MSRKTTAEPRTIIPDKRTGSETVAKFLNSLMRDGKKSVAQGILYSAFDIIGEKASDADPAEVFNQAVENVKPMVEVKSRRVGGANYQVPVEVRPGRRQALAFRWILDAARSRSERSMAERLANELLDAYNKTGSSIRKREEVHRMAEANKAFAHYRW